MEQKNKQSKGQNGGREDLNGASSRSIPVKDRPYIDTDGTRRINGLYCPDCFGDLETVFPMGERALRETPDDCMYLCAHKTLCLRDAMAGERGMTVKEEMVARDERPGVVGFFERWSKRKRLHREKKE